MRRGSFPSASRHFRRPRRTGEAVRRRPARAAGPGPTGKAKAGERRLGSSSAAKKERGAAGPPFRVAASAASAARLAGADSTSMRAIKSLRLAASFAGMRREPCSPTRLRSWLAMVCFVQEREDHSRLALSRGSSTRLSGDRAPQRCRRAPAPDWPDRPQVPRFPCASRAGRSREAWRCAPPRAHPRAGRGVRAGGAGPCAEVTQAPRRFRRGVNRAKP